MLVNDGFAAYTSFMLFFTKVFPMSMPENLPSKFFTYLTNNEDEGIVFTQCSPCDLSEDVDNDIDGASPNHLVGDKVRYSRDRRTGIVEIMDNVSEPFNDPKFTIKFKDGSVAPHMTSRIRHIIQITLLLSIR